MNDKDLEELMGFLMSTGQVDENFGLKEKQDDEDEKADEEENNKGRRR